MYLSQLWITNADKPQREFQDIAKQPSTKDMTNHLHEAKHIRL